MRDENYKVDVEPQEAYDWHHMELFQRPPYNHRNMIKLLNDGRFIIEGKPSNLGYAQLYAEHHHDAPEVWEALKELDDLEYDLTIRGQVF